MVNRKIVDWLFKSIKEIEVDKTLANMLINAGENGQKYLIRYILINQICQTITKIMKYATLTYFLIDITDYVNLII
jgi:hypothetical protein